MTVLSFEVFHICMIAKGDHAALHESAWPGRDDSQGVLSSDPTLPRAGRARAEKWSPLVSASGPRRPTVKRALIIIILIVVIQTIVNDNTNDDDNDNTNNDSNNSSSNDTNNDNNNDNDNNDNNMIIITLILIINII